MSTVSVIIPTYEGAETLPRAIESVLDQTFADLELLVVDDGSTDDTREVVLDYVAADDRVAYVPHEVNRGASAARNTGIEHASGEFVAFLDSDDEWLPEKLDAQVSRLRECSAEWIGVYCDAFFDLTGRSAGLRERLGWFLSQRRQPSTREAGRELIAEILSDRLHTHAGSSLLVRRSSAEAVDGFDESFDRFQDPEFLIRLLERGKLACVPERYVVRHDPDSSAPPSVVEASSRKFLDTFDEQVTEAEARGYDVHGTHNFALSKLFFGEGRFVRGATYLSGSRVAIHDLPGLGWAVFNGLYRRSAGAVADAVSTPRTDSA